MHVSPVCASEDLDAAVVPLLLPVLPRVCGSQNNNYSPTNSFVRLEHLARRRSGPAVTQSLNQLGTERRAGRVGGSCRSRSGSRLQLVGRGVARVWTTASRAQQRPAWTRRLTAQTGLTLGGVSFPPHSPCTKHFGGFSHLAFQVCCWVGKCHFVLFDLFVYSFEAGRFSLLMT